MGVDRENLANITVFPFISCYGLTEFISMINYIKLSQYWGLKGNIRKTSFRGVFCTYIYSYFSFITSSVYSKSEKYDKHNFHENDLLINLCSHWDRGGKVFILSHYYLQCIHVEKPL